MQTHMHMRREVASKGIKTGQGGTGMGAAALSRIPILVDPSCFRPLFRPFRVAPVLLPILIRGWPFPVLSRSYSTYQELGREGLNIRVDPAPSQPQGLPFLKPRHQIGQMGRTIP